MDPEDLTPSEDQPAFTAEEGDPIIPVEGEITIPAEAEETPGAPAEEPPKYQFKTEAELDDFIKSRQPVAPVVPEAPVAPAAASQDEDDEFADLEIFKGYRNPQTGEWVGEAPSDWNDFARKILKHNSPKVVAPKILEQIKNMTQKEREELKRIDAEFDKEYDALAAQSLVPARGTPEGIEVNKQITAIGAQFGQSSITKAHQLWSKIPKSEGGGLDYVPAKKVNPSKAVAAKIGSSAASNSAGKVPKAIPYSKLHAARSVDELIEEEDI